MYQSDHDNSDLEAFKIALIQLRAGDIEYAIDTLQELTCKSPENSIYWYTLGHAFGKAQRDYEAF